MEGFYKEKRLSQAGDFVNMHLSKCEKNGFQQKPDFPTRIHYIKMASCGRMDAPQCECCIAVHFCALHLLCIASSVHCIFFILNLSLLHCIDTIVAVCQQKQLYASSSSSVPVIAVLSSSFPLVAVTCQYLQQCACSSSGSNKYACSSCSMLKVTVLVAITCQQQQSHVSTSSRMPVVAEVFQSYQQYASI